MSILELCKQFSRHKLVSIFQHQQTVWSLITIHTTPFLPCLFFQNFPFFLFQLSPYLILGLKADVFFYFFPHSFFNFPQLALHCFPLLLQHLLVLLPLLLKTALLLFYYPVCTKIKVLLQKSCKIKVKNENESHRCLKITFKATNLVSFSSNSLRSLSSVSDRTFRSITEIRTPWPGPAVSIPPGLLCKQKTAKEWFNLRCKGTGSNFWLLTMHVISVWLSSTWIHTLGTTVPVWMELRLDSFHWESQLSSPNCSL